jgi:adenylate kinase
MLNIVVCGTPGTGKSSLIEKVKHELLNEKFNFINLSKFAIDNSCTLEYDDELGSHVVDEDKLVELLEQELRKGQQRNVIECIHGDVLPSDLVELVFVCRTNNTILYDRLKERGYNEKKVSNNMEAEIFQTILDEVRECFQESSIVELVNDEPEDLDKNAKIFLEKVRAYMIEL